MLKTVINDYDNENKCERILQIYSDKEDFAQIIIKFDDKEAFININKDELELIHKEIGQALN